MSRTYDLVHRTTYSYDEPVHESYGRTCMTPRELPDQHVATTSVTVDPAPADVSEHVDYFGNRSSFYVVTEDHDRLVVTSRSTVHVARAAASVEGLAAVAWDDVAAAVRAGDTDRLGTDDGGVVALREALLPSRHVDPSDEVRAWSAPTLEPGRPLPEVVAGLVHRIRTELEYRSGSTTVTTTQSQLLAQGAGVCQDFAHLMIAALRAHGVPARYTSGYLETRPPAGREKLRGADASHAWVSVWVPGAGWVEVDPTNDQFVDDRYVILGWGRDYADVPPLRGVVFTEGSGSRLRVEVDLVPTGAERFA